MSAEEDDSKRGEKRKREEEKEEKTDFEEGFITTLKEQYLEDVWNAYIEKWLPEKTLFNKLAAIVSVKSVTHSNKIVCFWKFVMGMQITSKIICIYAEHAREKMCKRAIDDIYHIFQVYSLNENMKLQQLTAVDLKTYEWKFQGLVTRILLKLVESYYGEDSTLSREVPDKSALTVDYIRSKVAVAIACHGSAKEVLNMWTLLHAGVTVDETEPKFLNFDLAHIHWGNLKTTMNSKPLEHIWIYGDFTGSEFRNNVFMNIKCMHAVKFDNCNFSRAKFLGNICHKGSSWIKANFWLAQLDGILSGNISSECTMEDANFTDATFTGEKSKGYELSGTDLLKFIDEHLKISVGKQEGYSSNVFSTDQLSIN